MGKIFTPEDKNVEKMIETENFNSKISDIEEKVIDLKREIIELKEKKVKLWENS